MYADTFTWDPHHGDHVRAEWQGKTSIRLKDMVHKAAKEPADKIIPWMIDDLRAGLKDKWEK